MVLVGTVLGVPPAATIKANPEVVRALRIKDGFSVAAFAREIGIAPSHLSNFEAGRDGVSIGVVRKMADVLKIPMSLLVLVDPGDGAAA